MPSHFESVAVISDLHLSPSQGLGNFSEAAGDSLVKWTQQRTKDRPDVSALVLAGDIVDFLLVEKREKRLDLHGAGTFVKGHLELLTDGFAWARKWRDALEGYCHAGGSLILIPGNHDPEWFHPDAESEFRKWVCQAGVSTPPKVCLDDTWQAQVGKWRVTVLHGHRHDPINDIDRETLFLAVAQGKKSFRLPPGSDLVLGPLRHFKKAKKGRDRRFPFLDSLKPEVPGVGWLLLALDPKLFTKHVPGFGLVLSRIIEQKLIGRNLFLSGQAPEADIPDPTELLSEELANGFVSMLPDCRPDDIPMRLQEIEDYLTEPAQTQPTLPMLGSSDRVRQYFLRAWLRNERTKSQSAAFFDKTKMDAFDNRIVTAHLLKDVSHQVIVAGHSHAARNVPLQNDCHYLNTGTWTDLMDVTTFGDSARDLELFLKQLKDGTLPRFTRLTWAEITPSGAVLREHS